jgi:phosphonate transport system substrate-binding protein
MQRQAIRPVSARQRRQDPIRHYTRDWRIGSEPVAEQTKKKGATHGRLARRLAVNANDRRNRRPGNMTRSIPRRDFSLALLSMGLSATDASAWEQRPLEVGLLPNLSVRTLMAQYQPVREYLQRTLRRAVQLSTAPDWSVFHRRVMAYEYDVMVTAIHVGRLAQLDRNYRPLVQLVPDIDCILACAQARPLASVSDLRGKALVLSNPQSLVAVRGLHWLAGNGLRRDRDFSIVHTPTDDSAGNVLVRGDAAAALISGGEFQAIAEPVRGQLRVMNRFARVPGFIVMVSPRVGADDVQSIRAALLAFNERSVEGRLFLARTGLLGVRAMPAGLMETMDPLMSETRDLLAVAS